MNNFVERLKKLREEHLVNPEAQRNWEQMYLGQWTNNDDWKGIEQVSRKLSNYARDTGRPVVVHTQSQLVPENKVYIIPNDVNKVICVNGLEESFVPVHFNRLEAVQ